ncbi:MAG: hypothetical protein BMS9Abin37_2822 [Acidobacteriota bacterium]|nr:MAG: hypothetical protein BMS9Abin37_2822 [Acidobacteriota bacterium]
MSLKEKLDRTRARFRETAPPEALSVMDAATQKLVDSDLASKILGDGEALPEFELPNVDGAVIRSSELLARGKLVLSIYRGVW